VPLRFELPRGLPRLLFLPLQTCHACHGHDALLSGNRNFDFGFDGIGGLFAKRF
jgi:hypothetical protein